MSRPTIEEIIDAVEKDPIQAVRLVMGTVIAAGMCGNFQLIDCKSPGAIADGALELADELIARTIAAPGS